MSHQIRLIFFLKCSRNNASFGTFWFCISQFRDKYYKKFQNVLFVICRLFLIFVDFQKVAGAKVMSIIGHKVYQKKHYLMLQNHLLIHFWASSKLTWVIKLFIIFKIILSESFQNRLYDAACLKLLNQLANEWKMLQRKFS